MVREIVQRGDIAITKIASADNLADPFTKPLTTKVFKQHVDGMDMRCNLPGIEPKWEIVSFMVSIH